MFEDMRFGRLRFSVGLTIPRFDFANRFKCVCEIRLRSNKNGLKNPPNLVDSAGFLCHYLLFSGVNHLGLQPAKC